MISVAESSSLQDFISHFFFFNAEISTKENILNIIRFSKALMTQ